MRISLAALAVVLTAALGLPAAAQDVPARAAFATKIAGVRARLAAVPDSQGLKQACDASLAAAERAADEGRYLVGLAGVRRCLPFASALEVLAKHSAAIGTDLDAFRRVWAEAGVDLKARRQALGDDPGATVPMAVRAMIESDLSTFENYYTSARLYGENTTVENGLLYLGFPYGVVDFVSFAAALPLPAPSPSPTLPDLGGALFALDGELLDFYKAQTSPEARAALAGTNSMFKVAQDLHTAHMSAGTLFEYLRTLESLTVNQTRGDEPPAAAALQARVAEYAPGNSAVDNSLADYFVQRARGLLAAGAPAVEERRYAAAIVNVVLPAYGRAVAGDVPDAAPRPDGKPVTVTLVRWPYT